MRSRLAKKIVISDLTGRKKKYAKKTLVTAYSIIIGKLKKHSMPKPSLPDPFAFMELEPGYSYFVSKSMR